jgi:2Fe-2S ferredoxin
MAMAKVRFLAHGRDWEVEVPVGTTLLQASKQIHAPEGDACGGVCACSTCHVYVTKGRELLSEAEEDEEDILDKAFDVKPVSRLGCQAKIGGADLVVELTRESRTAWYDEHPEERQKLPPGTPR